MDAESPEDDEATFKSGRSSMCHGRSSGVRRVGVNVDAILMKLEAERRSSESTGLLPFSFHNDGSRPARNSECPAQKQEISASLPVLPAPAAVAKPLIREPSPVSRKVAAGIDHGCHPHGPLHQLSPHPNHSQHYTRHLICLYLDFYDLREKDLRHHIPESALDYILTEAICHDPTQHDKQQSRTIDAIFIGYEPSPFETVKGWKFWEIKRRKPYYSRNVAFLEKDNKTTNITEDEVYATEPQNGALTTAGDDTSTTDIRTDQGHSNRDQTSVVGYNYYNIFEPEREQIERSSQIRMLHHHNPSLRLYMLGINDKFSNRPLQLLEQEEQYTLLDMTLLKDTKLLCLK
ncbi:hypothetical protein SeLEV6574_g02031 [Synchytrium endobioticum]|uniref:Retroviral polymerase SH3-like domain-containing protein n=1 Tax=Synchytrium endobioticum TaxID=286115 RepID=A0A507D9V0_9FUNG|nr:hypothetical protein SeLEV6574_g02031 [Synchytrium endobioticum]